MSLKPHSILSIGHSAATAIAWEWKREMRVTCIVKAAFAFADGGPMARAPAPPIFERDLHDAKNRLRSLRFASDLAPYRKRADVLFTGSAHAPGGAPVEAMTVALRLSEGARTLLDKALLVKKTGGFSRLPLLYEHAVGGPGRADNPFGEEPGEDGEEDELHVFDPADAGRVAGFAPIAPSMAPRRQRLGALPLPVFGPEPVLIPGDFDFDFFQVAPEDQRVGFLRGDEEIALEGLHATRSQLRMSLPRARGVARIFGLSRFGIADGRELAMVCDTLHVSGDGGQCLLTWRGSFAVPSAEALAAVRLVAGVESGGEALTWPSAEEVEAALGDDDEQGLSATVMLPEGAAPAPANATLQLDDDDFEVVSSASATALLGAAVPPVSGPSWARASLPVKPLPASVRGARAVGAETLPVASSAAQGSAAKSATLPFRPAAPGTPVKITAERKPRASSAGETLPVSSRAVAGAALPFGLGPAPASSPAAGAEVPPGGAASSEHGGGNLHMEAPASMPVATDAAEKVAAPSPAAPLATGPVEAAAEPKSGSPWAPVAESAPAAAPTPARRLPPKVDVKNKLYGSRKKG